MLCSNILLIRKLKVHGTRKVKYMRIKGRHRGRPYRYIFTFLRGGPRGRVIPGSIPNPEVKPPIADNTYPVWIGNVGRCLFDFFFLFISLLFFSLLSILFMTLLDVSIFFFLFYKIVLTSFSFLISYI